MPVKKPGSEGKKKVQPKEKAGKVPKRFGDSGDEWKQTFKTQ